MAAVRRRVRVNDGEVGRRGGEELLFMSNFFISTRRWVVAFTCDALRIGERSSHSFGEPAASFAPSAIFVEGRKEKNEETGC